MIDFEESNCSKRRCVNYIGMRELMNGDESASKNICVAFMFGIPDNIAYGDELHLKPIINQRNNIVYEEEV